MATYNPDFVNHYDIVPGPSINGKKSVDMTNVGLLRQLILKK